MSAIVNCTPWRLPTSAPPASRSLARATARSTAAVPIPTAWAATTRSAAASSSLTRVLPSPASAHDAGQETDPWKRTVAVPEARDADQGVRRGHDQARRLARNEEEGARARRFPSGIGEGIDQEQVGAGRAGHEGLDPVEAYAVLLVDRFGRARGGVDRRGIGEGDCAERFASGHGGKPVRTHLVRGESDQGLDDDRVVKAEQEPGRGAGPRKLDGRESGGGLVESESPFILPEPRGEPPAPPERPQFLRGEDATDISVGCATQADCSGIHRGPGARRLLRVGGQEERALRPPHSP